MIGFGASLGLLIGFFVLFAIGHMNRRRRLAGVGQPDYSPITCNTTVAGDARPRCSKT